MELDLSGRVALVTGAGGGIGRATALELARLGAAVLVNDLGTSTGGEGADPARAEAVAAEIRARGGRAAANAESVADFAAAGRIVAQAVAELGGVDILVNNAGLSVRGASHEASAEDFARVLASHAGGAFACTRHAAPQMIERGWGRIVNLVSRTGLTGIAGAAAYGTAKGAIFGLTNVASRDLARFGITVNAVNPASTRTRMVTEAVERMAGEDAEARARARGLVAALQPPEAPAALIAYLCTPAAAGLNGQVFLADGDRVGLFAPLAVTQQIERAGGWTPETLADAMGALAPHPLDDPYAG